MSRSSSPCRATSPDEDILPARQFPRPLRLGQTWVEALPPVAESDRRPARAGDGVSPIVIRSNDLASAWAVGAARRGALPGRRLDPRQREMAFRGGIDPVMYTLTGNYKADQVHVPALLERLGDREDNSFALRQLLPLIPACGSVGARGAVAAVRRGDRR